MIKAPKTVPIPIPAPASPTVATPAPISFAAVTIIVVFLRPPSSKEITFFSLQVLAFGSNPLRRFTSRVLEICLGNCTDLSSKSKAFLLDTPKAFPRAPEGSRASQWGVLSKSYLSFLWLDSWKYLFSIKENYPRRRHSALRNLAVPLKCGNRIRTYDLQDMSLMR